ncbi:MAG: hypothetical protein PV353_10235, partial [Bartonella sp.]|nr:hypothetical protein [Bartonella sp.]
ILSNEVGIFSIVPGIVSLKNSEIRSKILLENYGRDLSMSTSDTPIVDMLRVSANHSVLEGSALSRGVQYSFLTLEDDSKWVIPIDLKSNTDGQLVRQRQECGGVGVGGGGGGG